MKTSLIIAPVIAAWIVAAGFAPAQAQTTQAIPDRSMDQSDTERPSVYNADRPIPNAQPASHPSRLPPIGHNDGTSLKNPPPPPDADNVLTNPPAKPDDK